jgi:hypothetical protein
MPELECKNYNIDLLEILRVYKKFELKVLACNIYQKYFGTVLYYEIKPWE